jgi:hypothetical protein
MALTDLHLLRQSNYELKRFRKPTFKKETEDTKQIASFGEFMRSMGEMDGGRESDAGQSSAGADRQRGEDSLLVTTPTEKSIDNTPRGKKDRVNTQFNYLMNNKFFLSEVDRNELVRLKKDISKTHKEYNRFIASSEALNGAMDALLQYTNEKYNVHSLEAWRRGDFNDEISGVNYKKIFGNATEIIEVRTDTPQDCDDQADILRRINNLKDGQEITFVVDSEKAAIAVAEVYILKKGHWPLIAIGKSAERELPSHSLLDGKPIADFKDHVQVPTVLLEERQEIIDGAIRDSKVDQFTQIVLAPPRSPLECYNVNRLPFNPESDQYDSALKDKWDKVPKRVIMQFKRYLDDKDGIKKLTGNNFNKSEVEVKKEVQKTESSQEISEPSSSDAIIQKPVATEKRHYGKEIVAMWEKQKNVTQVFGDGVIAKYTPFRMLLDQKFQKGLKKAAEKYTERQQAASWTNHTEVKGVLPGPEKTRVGRFTKGGVFPTGMHLIGIDFGLDRLIREGLKISPERCKALKQQMDAENDRFDDQVREALLHSHSEYGDIANAGILRQRLHNDTYNTLQSYGRDKGILGENESVGSFEELFNKAQEKHITFNAYTYMTSEFRPKLFAASPLTKDVTAIAEVETDKLVVDGKSHRDLTVDIISEFVCEIIYDAIVDTAADKVVFRDKGLIDHFKDKEISTDNNIVLDMSEVNFEALKKKPLLFSKFRNGVVGELSRHGIELLGQEEWLITTAVNLLFGQAQERIDGSMKTAMNQIRKMEQRSRDLFGYASQAPNPIPVQ